MNVKKTLLLTICGVAIFVLSVQMIPPENSKRFMDKHSTVQIASAQKAPHKIKNEKEPTEETKIDFEQWTARKNKGLLSSRETVEIKDNFQDPVYITAAFERIKKLDSPEANDEIQVQSEVEHIHAVNFIVDALQLPGNREKDHIATQAQDYILHHHIKSDLGLAQKKALLGNKIDLLVALYNYAPRFIAQIKREISGNEKMNRLLKYAEQRYEFDQHKNTAKNGDTHSKRGVHKKSS